MLERLMQFISNIGAKGSNVATMLFSLAGLLYDSLAGLFMGGKKGFESSIKQIVNQILFTGVEAFWLVGIIGLLCGITIIIQAMTNMPKFGVGEYFGNILIIVVIRELGPFFTSLVVVGRSGSALATYIGNMRVGKEIAALEVMGIDPVHFLVMPALVAMIISMVCLGVYFDIIAIIGGYFVAQATVNIPFNIFMSTVLDALSWQDIFISMCKNSFFGAIIALMSCYYGLNVNNLREVPQAALKSVVGCMIWTLLINILITIVFYARQAT